jgi:3-carboxy-cis,cis-muconate cycloisomerase
VNPLTSSNPYFAGLFADQEITALFEGAATADAFLAYEMALTRAAAEVGQIDTGLAQRALAAMVDFTPDVAGLQSDLSADGMAVPGYVRQLKAHVGAECAAAVHPGATSQDLIDTAQALALRAANEIYISRLTTLIDALRDLEETHGDNRLMGRTRMQAALPISAGHRISSWIAPLVRHTSRLEMLRPEVEALQFGGPVGDGQRSQPHAAAMADHMGKALGLRAPERCWHTERDSLVTYAGWLSALTGSLGKFGQDVCLMVQQGVDALAQAGGGSSSAMAHKQNPVTAEMLVTLSRYNAGQVALMHQASVHEQERSGAMWTLEWMVLPAMMTCTGAALRLATRQVQAIKRVGEPPTAR